jgi:hypothetical protein
LTWSARYFKRRQLKIRWKTDFATSGWARRRSTGRPAGADEATFRTAVGLFSTDRQRAYRPPRRIRRWQRISAENGHISINVFAEGDRFTIKASDDLKTWTEVGTYDNAAGLPATLRPEAEIWARLFREGFLE